MNSFWIKIILLLPFLSGCGGFVYHKVESGDTLYSIGKKYGKSYKNIARWNQLEAPFVLKKGQRVRLTPPTSGLFSDPSQTISNTKAIPAEVVTTFEAKNNNSNVTELRQYVKPVSVQPVSTQSLSKPIAHIVKNDPKSPAQSLSEVQPIKFTGWSWPTQGKVTKYFSFKNEKKGIEVSGRVGQPVRAAAAGRVIYSGNGLDKYYKNLIVIEHENSFLSTYGHNKKRLVKEGDYVAGGESVAKMGTSSSGGALLYFEIRKNGKPVNPLSFLSKK